MRDLLNGWIARFRTTGTYTRLLEKYGMTAPKQ